MSNQNNFSTGGVLYEKIFSSSGIGCIYLGSGISGGNSGGGQFLQLEVLAMRNGTSHGRTKAAARFRLQSQQRRQTHLVQKLKG